MIRLIIILSLSVLACVTPAAMIQPIPAPTVTASPTVTVTPNAEQTFSTIGYVYIRQNIGGEWVAIDYLAPGKKVQCTLKGKYCVLSDMTRVWSGCLSPNPERLGCKEK